MSNFWRKINNFLYIVFFNLISRKLISFGLVGISGVLVQFLVFFLLDYFNNLDFLANNLISILLGNIWGYFFNNLLTFKNNPLKGIDFFKGMISYLIISSISIIINISSSTLFFNLLNQKIIAILSGVIMGFFFNFFVSRKIIWKEKKNYF